MPIRLVWAMNVAPPYRVPVWDQLARRLALQVWLLSANEHNRRWAVPRDREFAVRLLRTKGVRRGETVHYVLTQRLGQTSPLPDALILPGWDSPAAWQMLWWAKRHGVPTLAFNESTLDSWQYATGPVDRARRMFFRKVDGVLTVSPGSTAAALASGVPRTRITQVVNAVDVEMIAAASARDDPKVAGAPHVFLFCGQLISRKLPTLLIEALALMADDSQLLVAGDGPLFGEMRTMAKRYGLQDRVELLGYVDPNDLPEVFRRGDTLVLPSEQEVYGLVVTEALAAGLHAIVSQRAGVAEVVRGMPGTWVTQPDVKSLSECMSASKLAWAGPVDQPTARMHSPQVMASEIQGAVLDLATTQQARPNSAP